MVFNKIGSKIKEINHPLKVAARIGVTVPILLCIIAVWSYFIIKSAEPLVKNDMQSTNPAKNKVTIGDDNDILGWNPFKKFCSAQVINVDKKSGSSDSVTTASAVKKEKELVCPSNKIKYKCETYKNNRCTSKKFFNTSKSWCDLPSLNNTKNADGSYTELQINVIQNCCDDIEYHSNINYIGLVTYMVITIPLIYLLIEKILSNFVIKNINLGGDNVKNQFEWLGEYISKNGANILILVLSIIFIGLPLFRFFFVSYKCEDVSSQSGDNCGNTCKDSNDCATLHGNGCTFCINNQCEKNIEFTDKDDALLGNIEMSVCSVKSIINDIDSSKIDDLYSTFVGGSATSMKDKKRDILTYIGNNTTKEREVSSYYYKFYPRQEITFNDTDNPFAIRLPNPKVASKDSSKSMQYNPISGFNYLLNNYIELEDYKPPPGSCKSYKEEHVCNKNHNCKFKNSACKDNKCPNSGNRYKFPGLIQSVITHQNIDDLDLHNKVVRDGMHYNSTIKSYPKNAYPCNDVVISNNLKEAAKNDVNKSKNISGKAPTWINHYELKRVECADKRGKCYMDDYVCKTKTNIPIPLKKLSHPDTKEHTVEELTDKGCQHAVYPCENENKDCTALTSTNGYVTEVPKGGKCKRVKWTTNMWKPTDDDKKLSKLKCIPKSKKGNLDTSNGGYIPSFEGAKVASWIGSPSKKDVMTECKSVTRMPRITIKNNPSSNVSHYYRWSPLSGPGKLLCSDWDGSCPSGKTKNLRGIYVGKKQLEMCCNDANVTNNPIGLYVTGQDVVKDQPNTIAGIVAKGKCSEWGTKNNCPKGKKIKNKSYYSVGTTAHVQKQCCS